MVIVIDASWGTRRSCAGTDGASAECAASRWSKDRGVWAAKPASANTGREASAGQADRLLLYAPTDRPTDRPDGTGTDPCPHKTDVEPAGLRRYVTGDISRPFRVDGVVPVKTAPTYVGGRLDALLARRVLMHCGRGRHATLETVGGRTHHACQLI
jgi:hypothetical protein